MNNAQLVVLKALNVGAFLSIKHYVDRVDLCLEFYGLKPIDISDDVTDLTITDVGDLILKEYIDVEYTPQGGFGSICPKGEQALKKEVVTR